MASAADDVVAWDQNGCLSPHVIYVEERWAVELPEHFAQLLAVELARREASEPRGKIADRRIGGDCVAPGDLRSAAPRIARKRENLVQPKFDRVDGGV